jgi:hypothetical protein
VTRVIIGGVGGGDLVRGHQQVHPSSARTLERFEEDP